MTENPATGAAPEPHAALAPTTEPGQTSGVSRRGMFLGAFGAGAAGLLVGGAAGAATVAVATARQPDSAATVPFTGTHQAGITTPAQDRLHFAAFDLNPGLDRAGLIALLRDWTNAAARMTQGLPVTVRGATSGPDDTPPDDTGEALGLPAAALTITFGFGPGLFTDRFGTTARRPPLLQPLPRFAGDALEPRTSGGDLAIQACANDPQVAVHAIRNLTRIAFGRAVLRWSQLGFGRTSSTSKAQTTARNLFGFKDGTANIKAEDADIVNDQVWVQAADGPDWLVGGSYLVSRRIRMLIENWDRTQLGEQERVIGRSKGEGAPLSGGGEFTAPDFAATTQGSPRIDVESHVRRAHPTTNGGAQLLRRGYNFVDGNDGLGQLNAGLFFLAYMRSPQQFITIQRSLATDAMGEYIKHVGSVVFAVPSGIAPGEYVGQRLFA